MELHCMHFIPVWLILVSLVLAQNQAMNLRQTEQPGTSSNINKLSIRTNITKCSMHENHKDGNCCGSCSIAEGVVSSCNEENDTICAGCQHGLTYMNERMHRDPCKPCSLCPEGAYVEQSCNTTHDTVCSCLPGFYFDDSANRCHECLHCPVGSGASPACSAKRNTVCVPCPLGTFSSVDSATQSCQTCTHCAPYQIALQDCMPYQDAVCFNMKTKAQPSPSTLTKDCQASDCDSKQQTYMYTAPLYCAILGSIVVGLLVYVVLRYRTNKLRPLHNNAKICVQTALNILPYTYERNVSPMKHLGDSSVVYLQSSGNTVTTSCTRTNCTRTSCDRTSCTRFRHLSCAVQDTIQQALLSSKLSWITLAKHLGLTGAQLATVSYKAERYGKSPVYYLLKVWSKRQPSSLGELAAALERMNRVDLVHYLKLIEDSALV